RTASPDAQAFAQEHGLPLVPGLDDVLADDGVDAVVLATPHSQHAQQAVASARAGKHVFCEKPFALRRADAEAAVDAVRRGGGTLGLGYNRRFHPAMSKPRERIRSGDL